MLWDGDLVKNYDCLSICSGLLLIIASIDLKFNHGYVRKDSSDVVSKSLITC